MTSEVAGHDDFVQAVRDQVQAAANHGRRWFETEVVSSLSIIFHLFYFQIAAILSKTYSKSLRPQIGMCQHSPVAKLELLCYTAHKLSLP